MKVCMVGWEFYPYNVGGLGVHCYELAAALSEHGIDVHFFLPKLFREDFDWLKLHKIDMGVDVNNLYSGDIRFYNQKISEEFEKINEEEKFDIIHCHDWLTVEAGVNVKKKLNMPFVLTFHSLSHMRTCQDMYDYTYSLEAVGTALADRIITVSEWMKRSIVERYYADPKNITVIYNGVSKKRGISAEEKGFLRNRYNINNKLVLFVGRLTEQKGPEYLLKAAQLVLESNPGVKFIFTGKGHLEESLKRYSRILGVEDSLMFTGFLEKRKTDGLYAAADVVVVPSVYEPFGLTITEAISAGTPVVASRSAGACEILGEDSFVVQEQNSELLAGKILEILNNQELANHKAMEVKNRLEKNFSWNRIAKDTIKVYEDVLKAH